MLPLESAHHPIHDDGQDDEEHEHAEKEEPPAPDEMDPELDMHPPQVQELIKETSLMDGVNRLVADDQEMPTPADIINYQYPRATDAAKKEAEETIRKLLLDRDSTAQQRVTALGVLNTFDDPMLDVRRDMAANDPDMEVRKAALGGLANVQEPSRELFATLKELTDDPNSEIRQLAQDILIQLETRGGEFGIHALIQDLGQFKNDASALAATHLVTMGKKTLPYLIDAAKNDPNKFRRHGAASCIAMICAGDNPSLRKFSEQAQATRVTEDWQEANLAGLEPMIYVLQNDTYAPARAIAAQGLGYLGDEKAARPLAEALEDPDEEVRRRAAAALVTVPSKSVVRQIGRAALNDPSPAVRLYAVTALGHSGVPGAISPLAEATKDEQADVRMAAAEQLGRLKAKTALNDLVAMFDDPNQDVRWEAVRAVGELETKEAAPYLLEALKDEYPQVSNAAERGLEKLGIAKRKPTGLESAGQD
ncbi:MAG: HEAT repeat domain-containing protein [Armatimonadota bacterium]